MPIGLAMSATQESGEASGGVGSHTQPEQDNQSSMDIFLQRIETMLENKLDRKLEVMKQELIVHFTNQGEGMIISGC